MGFYVCVCGGGGGGARACKLIKVTLFYPSEFQVQGLIISLIHAFFFILVLKDSEDIKCRIESGSRFLVVDGHEFVDQTSLFLRDEDNVSNVGSGPALTGMGVDA